jgi:hypothetical protein
MLARGRGSLQQHLELELEPALAHGRGLLHQRLKRLLANRRAIPPRHVASTRALARIALQR